MALLWVALCVTLLSVARGAIDADLVTDLPGLQSPVAFKHYSGYLRASDTHYLHYWFLESQGNPSRDPVVMWMNGGPGCSSMDGLLQEHGPFLVDREGKTLIDNPFSWNKAANMLYLEAPAGVGFSYSSDGIYNTNDDKTAADNLNALKYFFKMFPEFSSNEFYITGESYGGIYVPTLSVLVYRDQTLNLKGMAIGNGITNFAWNTNSVIFFGYYHGLFGRQLWDQLTSYCCVGGKPDNCNFYDNQDADCQNAANVASSIIYSLNVYNLYGECYTSSVSNRTSLKHPIFDMFKHNRHVSAQHEQLLQMPKYKVTATPPCIYADGLKAYLNRDDVKAAIHIHNGLPTWDVCSDILHYTTIYQNMTAQYLEILRSGKLRVLVYNGDVDMACNFLGDQWFVESLKQKVVSPYRAWHYTAEDGSTQVAGFAKGFKNLNMVTIKGAGHMVPQDKPRQATVMLNNFLKDQPFK